jgi:hypothetical protein
MAPEQFQRMTSDAPSPNDKVWVEKIPTPQFYTLFNQVIPFLDRAVQDKPELRHNWSVLREHLSACHVYVNWSSILIRPIIPPTLTHDAFSNANQRLYMSATLGLGGELERITGRDKIQRIKAPEGWEQHGVGRRLFFFPGSALKEEESNMLVRKLVEESPRALILVPDQQSADELIAEFQISGGKTTFQAAISSIPSECLPKTITQWPFWQIGMTGLILPGMNAVSRSCEDYLLPRTCMNAS